MGEVMTALFTHRYNNLDSYTKTGPIMWPVFMATGKRNDEGPPSALSSRTGQGDSETVVGLCGKTETA